MKVFNTCAKLFWTRFDFLSVILSIPGWIWSNHQRNHITEELNHWANSARSSSLVCFKGRNVTALTTPDLQYTIISERFAQTCALSITPVATLLGSMILHPGPKVLARDANPSNWLHLMDEPFILFEKDTHTPNLACEKSTKTHYYWMN